MQGSCQKFARNCATRNLTSPHDPSLGSVFHLRGCAGTWVRVNLQGQGHGAAFTTRSGAPRAWSTGSGRWGGVVRTDGSDAGPEVPDQSPAAWAQDASYFG